MRPLSKATSERGRGTARPRQPPRARNAKNEAFGRVVPAFSRANAGVARRPRMRATSARDTPRGVPHPRGTPGETRARARPPPGRRLPVPPPRALGRSATSPTSDDADTCAPRRAFPAAGVAAFDISAFRIFSFFFEFPGPPRRARKRNANRRSPLFPFCLSLRSADASGGGYWSRAPAPPLFADVAKKGTAGVASEVRAPGAAPSAETNAVAANADAPGDSASAAESDRETRLSLDALSLGTSAGGPGDPGDAGDPGGPGPDHTPGVVGPDGAPGTAAGAGAGAGAYAAYPGYNAHGYPAGTAYEASSGPVPSGMYPQHMVPHGMPGMPGMLSPELAMQQQHAAMLYHQQTDPAAVFAYYRAAAESGDPQAAEALEAMRASLPASPPLEGSSSPVDAPGGGGAGNLGAPTHFSAEMYAAQMHQLSQIGAHHMHAPMWDPHAAAYGNQSAGWAQGPGDARHQQWQQHAGYARSWGAHDAGAHAAVRENGAMGNYPYARGAYGGSPSGGGWKPPSPRLGGGGRRDRLKRAERA